MANTLKFGDGQWATKYGSTLAYNDENGNFKPLPFLFERRGNATRVNKEGLIEIVGENIPRIDYLNDSNGALLLEPSRTNITYPSENFSNQLQGASATFGTLISPDGTLNGSTIASTADGAYKGWHETYSLTDDTYTFSMFVKYYNSQWISIYRIGQAISRFDVKNGVFGNNPSNLKSVNYGNGWYRLEFTFTAASGTNWLYIYPSSDTGETSSAGDGLYIWGGQLEQGSYATSYIKTTSAAVTRLADVCSQTPPDGVIGQTEGVLYCEVDVKSGYDTNNLMVTLSNGTNLKQIYINRSNGKLEFFVGTNLNEMLYVSPSVLSSGIHKLALAYKQDDFAVAIDGVIAHTDNSGNVPTCNKINVGSHYNENLPFNDRVNNVKLYNTRLSNSELAALTQV
jgi:hypothetical protein